MPSNKAVFLDRDGVLNDPVDRGPDFMVGNKRIRFTAPFTLSELVIKPGVADALQLMNDHGYLPIVVTNQPDVTNGLMEVEQFMRIMWEFNKLPLNGYYYCMHGPDAGCTCRKPGIGLFLRAATRFELDLSRCVMVGDMATDIEAGRAAGVARTFLIDAPYNRDVTTADHRVADLMAVALRLPR